MLHISFSRLNLEKSGIAKREIPVGNFPPTLNRPYKFTLIFKARPSGKASGSGKPLQASCRQQQHQPCRQLSRLDSCVSGNSCGGSDLPDVSVIGCGRRSDLDKCSSFISAITTESLVTEDDECSYATAGSTSVSAASVAAAKKRRRKEMRRLSSPTLAGRR